MLCMYELKHSHGINYIRVLYNAQHNRGDQIKPAGV